MMKIKTEHAWLALLSLLSLALAGCAGTTVRPEQPARSQTIVLDAQNGLGQTLTAHYAGLNSLHVYLSPLETGEGQITLHLRSGPQEADELRTGSIPLAQVNGPGYYAFEFAPLEDSNRRDYYAEIEMQGPGRVEAGTAGGEVYLFGALYQNGQAQDAQLTFGLGYDPALQLSSLFREGLTWALWLLAGLALYILPGWALLDGLWKDWGRLRFWEKFGLASGASLAIYPLLVLWTGLAGLRLGPLYAWLPPLIGLAALVWRHRASLGLLPLGSLPQRLRRMPERLKSVGTGEFWPGLAMLLILGLIVGTRLWAIRRLDLPLWGDSYQHTMIAQLLVDHGGLFENWAPYAELTSLTYHFGYHTLIAAYHWVTGLPLPQSILVASQLLNVLAVAALYPLARRLGRNAWAGVAAALVAGLIAPMPMYYLNWGRYTQLAGQVILPAVVLLAWTRLESEQKEWPLTALCWITLGGLALTHMRVLVFSVVFFAAYFLINLRRMGFWTLVRRTFWTGIGGAILFLPWLVHLYAGEYMNIFARQVTTPPSQMSGFTQQYNAIGDLLSYLPGLAWVLLLAAAAWGLWRRERAAVTVGLWWLLLLLAANPQWLGLPGAGALTSFAVLIAAYIPAGALIGAAAGWGVEEAQAAWQRANRPAEAARRTAGWLAAAGLAILLVAAGAWGARRQLRLVDPLRFTLASRADLRAMEWIRQNTPADTRFLVNSFFAYGGSLVAGSDGGWWIPLLTQRPSTQPPLNYGTEEGIIPGYRAWINETVRMITDQGLTDPDTLALLKDRGVGYVYVGQQQGMVGTLKPLLDLQTLLSDPHFTPIYHQDRVWIFEIK
jgi:hypothetical protein